jgi:hypothetical protein
MKKCLTMRCPFRDSNLFLTEYGPESLGFEPDYWSKYYILMLIINE